jgi:hypothetical protein
MLHSRKLLSASQLKPGTTLTLLAHLRHLVPGGSIGERAGTFVFSVELPPPSVPRQLERLRPTKTALAGGTFAVPAEAPFDELARSGQSVSPRLRLQCHRGAGVAAVAAKAQYESGKRRHCKPMLSN